jgi:hypothetical protein
MNRYQLKVLGYDGVSRYTVYAEAFDTDFGRYAFMADGQLVACYPIDRTIIENIEKIDE